MADTTPESVASAAKPEIKVDAKAANPLKPPNPMWKYMGLGENFRPKLPSRNWSIFLAITGSFTAAVVYDKREKKRAQRKWCKLVEHIAKEPLDSKVMPRKLTIFLEGPPTDGLRVAQDHFKEYVKPILVASGLDWEFIQGRKEGDVRAELAEKIRNSRLPRDQRTEDNPVGDVRLNTGIQEFPGPGGDIVIGRHTWKEYVRGLHEGWLGPLTEPHKPVIDPEAENDAEVGTETFPKSGITLLSTPREADVPPAESAETPKPDEKSKKPPQPPPFITTSAYQSAPTPVEFPAELNPSQPISFPHILGFLNTPKRLYRFLNRRVLADQIGRETAAVVLSTYRPYREGSPTSFSADGPADTTSPQSTGTTPTQAQTAEQQTTLSEEEKEWHKSIRVRSDGEAERTWLEPIILDPRIASRMRRFELTAEDEERAKKIVVSEVEVEGWIKGRIRNLGKSAIQALKGKEKRPVYVESEEDLNSASL